MSKRRAEAREPSRDGRGRARTSGRGQSKGGQGTRDGSYTHVYSDHMMVRRGHDPCKRPPPWASASWPVTAVTQRDDSLSGPGPLNTFKQLRYKADRRVSRAAGFQTEAAACTTQQTSTLLLDVKDRLLSVCYPLVYGMRS